MTTSEHGIQTCRGITKDGNGCQVKRGLINGYCRAHLDQDPEQFTDGWAVASMPRAEAPRTVSAGEYRDNVVKVPPRSLTGEHDDEPRYTHAGEVYRRCTTKDGGRTYLLEP